METAIGIVIGGVIGAWLTVVLTRESGRRREAKPAGTDRIYGLVEEIREYYDQSAQPTDLLEHAAFERGVLLLRGDGYTTDDLLAYYNGDNAIIACMALEALSRRTDGKDDLFEPIARTLNTVPNWTRFFALRALETRGVPPLVGRLLVRLDRTWDNRLSLQFLRAFTAARVGSGEAPSFGDGLEGVPEEQGEFLDRVVLELGEELAGTLGEELVTWRSGRVDTGFLASFGTLWDHQDTSDIVLSDQLRERVTTVEETLCGDRPRSVLLVGRPGVGKTTLLRALAARLRARGWVTFEASAAGVLAGQSFIGELEGRVQRLLGVLSGQRRVLWVVPGFHELLWVGRHLHNPSGILDHLLPAIEMGRVVVAGETEPSAYERLLVSRPRLRGILETFSLEPTPAAESQDLAREWWRARADGVPAAELLGEAQQLAEQYLGEQAAPGNLLQLLELTLDQHRDRKPAEIRGQHLLATVSRLTGLPLSILDDDEAVDLAGLRRLFEKRVLGQSEAVDCLVERVAMVKAGLTDPTRPYGVFLFTGPTGTGKTELAKALAEFLFGSERRMLRLDMSEYQTADSLSRILGEGDELSRRSALVDQVRNQPFSLLLLDEFEKAHPGVWDVFLQLFDDGRLSDRLGNVTDFRHTIVIMTANIGGDAARAGSIGFRADPAAAVNRSLESVFRKEFLNRIDRVVVFQALRRSVMRDILHKELDEVLNRRGLRNRTWAVEWEESAIDFLLARGFTEDMGARPLKRAIERYLLAPLARTIVDHQHPAGDQFLFVRSDGGKIDVVFVDPDAPDDVAATPAPEGARPERLEQVVLDPRGERAERDYLCAEHDRLAAIVAGEAWKTRKQEALAAMAEPAFWESPGRFETLGLAEYLDRIEVGMRTAGSLLARLTRGGDGRTQFSRPLIGRLAHQLYLVDAACRGLQAQEPWDAFLLVESSRDPTTNAAATDRFAARVGEMYREWARRRGMRTEILEEPGGGGGYRHLLAVSGFGAYTILRPEHGLHVLEVPGAGRGTVRHKVRVRVHPQPAVPARTAAEALAQALAVLDEASAGHLEIVRRYREEPSPLVKDTVRNWRTGLLDRVLAGDFDLL